MLGRETSDAVTTLGTGVNGSVRLITTAYDGQGNAYLVTSYNATSGGSVVNQVEQLYNGVGQMTADYQSASGAVSIGTTPVVQYAYTEMSGGVDNSRLTSITYPDGYVLTYNYSTGLNNTISRLSSLSDTTGTLESYKYLGLDTVVERDHPQTDVNQTLISQSGGTGVGGDKYVGLDQFGRVVNDLWTNTSTSTTTDEFQYGYDDDGDVLYRQNTVNTAFGELYTYDGENELATFERGTLNSTDTGITGTASATQNFTTDGVGNFTNVTTNGTSQTRTANAQNEITSISSATPPTYDANGNMTGDQNGNKLVYDALGPARNRQELQWHHPGDERVRRAEPASGRRRSAAPRRTCTTRTRISCWSRRWGRGDGPVRVESGVRQRSLVLRDFSDRNAPGTLNQRRLWVCSRTRTGT